MKAEDFDTAFYPGGHGPKSRISEGNYFAKSTATSVLRPAIWHYIFQAHAYEMAWSQELIPQLCFRGKPGSIFGIRLRQRFPNSVTTRPIRDVSDVPKDGGKEKRTQAPANEGRLAASLAHEINNPLESLLNLLYLMETEATLTEKGRHYLEMAEEEVRRISQIAHAVLQDSRQSAVLMRTNVPQLLAAVIDFYHSRLEAKGISVNTRFRDNGDLGVYADSLRQLFSNLVLNAADAMPEGGRILARAQEAQEWSGEYRHGLRVTIADNGSGIPADKLPMILEPFFTTKGDRGIGLGLALVKDVVQRHRGALRIRSSTRYGHSGSVFSIFLPA